MTPEYARLMGVTATQGKSAMPGPFDVGAKLWEHLKRPFYDNGPTTRAWVSSSAIRSPRVGLGYFLAVDGRDSARLPDRDVALDQQGARPVHYKF